VDKILITGASGFIGRALTEVLLDQGKNVTAVVLPSEKSKLKPHSSLTVIQGDFNDMAGIKAQLESLRFDVMYHLVWVGVSTTYKNDQAIQIKNLSFALSAMELAKMTRCKKVISTGSVSEYAYVDGAVSGKQIACPSDIYSATKVAVHTYCDLIARQNGMDFHWVLISSVYGPGRDDDNLITYSIKTLLAGRRPSYTKLEQRWDYIYIDDLISALVLIGEKGKGSKVYAVGSGTALPLHEYVEILKSKVNPTAKLGIGEVPYKTSRIDNSIVDISELQMDTGFAAKVSFEDGITKTIAYFKDKVRNQKC